MFSSTIIPTINRPTLYRAVCSVLEQEFTSEDFEVIVVNDSGMSLPASEWQQNKHIRVINTNRCERSFARNTGAAIAKGKYLHFLDDDDILLSGALAAFWELSQKKSDASWLFGSWQTVDNDGSPVDEFHPDLNGNIFSLLVSGESLPLQASLLKTQDFLRVGGYDPAPILTGVEDRDLGRRIAYLGTIAHTPATVAQVRIGRIGSSTNWAIIAEGDRWGREKALQAPKSLKRLHDSVSDNYWRGRVSRAYYASTVWNLKHGSPLISTSRFLSGLAMTGPYFFSKDFWNGLRTKIE